MDLPDTKDLAKLVKFSIYCIENLETGLKYVGQTRQAIAVRFQQHLYASGYGSETPLHSAIRKHGAECFKYFEVATTEDPARIDDLEREKIKEIGTLYPNGYNATTGGQDIWRPIPRESIERDPIALIDDLTKSELKSLVRICRANGISSMKINGLEFSLSPYVPESYYKRKKKNDDTKSDHIPTTGPDYVNDPEAAIDWSSGGIPRGDN